MSTNVSRFQKMALTQSFDTDTFCRYINLRYVSKKYFSKIDLTLSIYLTHHCPCHFWVWAIYLCCFMRLFRPCRKLLIRYLTSNWASIPPYPSLPILSWWDMMKVKVAIRLFPEKTRQMPQPPFDLNMLRRAGYSQGMKFCGISWWSSQPEVPRYFLHHIPNTFCHQTADENPASDTHPNTDLLRQDFLFRIFWQNFWSEYFLILMNNNIMLKNMLAVLSDMCLWLWIVGDAIISFTGSVLGMTESNLKFAW